MKWNPWSKCLLCDMCWTELILWASGKTPHWFFCSMDTKVDKKISTTVDARAALFLDPTLPIWLNWAMPMFMVCSVIMSLDSIRLWVRFQKNLRKYCLPLARVHFSFVIHENIVHHFAKVHSQVRSYRRDLGLVWFFKLTPHWIFRCKFECSYVNLI